MSQEWDDAQRSSKRFEQCLLWLVWDFTGIRFICRKIIPEIPDTISSGKNKKRVPATFTLWTLGIYVALFGITSTRYELSLDRIEGKLNTTVAQLDPIKSKAFKNLIARIPVIQKEKIPVQPSIFNPFSIVRSLFFPAEQNTGIIKRTIEEVIEVWKEDLEGVNLMDVDLTGAYLWDANLTGASLEKANLTEADLWKADLTEAHLWKADLTEAHLWKADLTKADLWKADLTKADLREINLTEAYLREANLTGASLEKANLTEADLWKADLTEAYLREANLTKADLWKADLTKADLREINLTNTNIRDVNNAPEGFKEDALMEGAVDMGWFEWKTFVDNGYKKWPFYNIKCGTDKSKPWVLKTDAVEMVWDEP